MARFAAALSGTATTREYRATDRALSRQPPPPFAWDWAVLDPGTTDPQMIVALQRLLSDEALHGKFGFHYLAAREDTMDGALRDSLARYLRHAFAVIEPELAPRPPFRPTSDSERAFGIDDPELAREVFYGTMQGAIIPGLEQAGIAAEVAWKRRARAA